MMGANSVLTQPNLDKARREALRWHLLTIANVARPQSMNVAAMLPIITCVYQDATDVELRRHLDYLEERELVKISKDPLDNWAVELTRWGVDIVEYTVDCEPGIARPRASGA
jgi:hypothetical protein